MIFFPFCMMLLFTVCILRVEYRKASILVRQNNIAKFELKAVATAPGSYVILKNSSDAY